jgi:hypothetical protein
MTDIPEEITDYYAAKARDLPRGRSDTPAAKRWQEMCNAVVRELRAQDAVYLARLEKEAAIQAILDDPENTWTEELIQRWIRENYYK